MIMWFWGGLWGGALGVAEFAVAGIAVEKGSGKQGTKKGKKTTTSRKQLGRQKRERERERERKERPKLPAQSLVAATCLILNSVDACVRWEMQMFSVFPLAKRCSDAPVAVHEAVS